MRKVTITLASLGILTFSVADDISIDAEIEAIKNAPLQERVRLMNQFKQKLSQLNQEERSEAIEKLQIKTQTQTQTRTELQERTQKMQMNNEREISQMNNMNQQQAGQQSIKGR